MMRTPGSFNILIKPPAPAVPSDLSNALERNFIRDSQSRLRAVVLLEDAVKRPTYSKILDLLDILFAYTGASSYALGTNNQYKDCPVYEVWDRLCTQYVNPSRTWAPMVQAWYDAGVHGAHVYYACGPVLTLSRLIKQPEDFAVRCRMRGFDVPAIDYPCSLDEGPAWEAVKRHHKAWTDASYETVATAVGVPVRKEEPLPMDYGVQHE